MDHTSEPGLGPSRWPLLPPLAGLLGLVVILAGLVLPALAYVGRAGQRYSPLNHFISELGELDVSPLAWLFNGSLVISGLVMALLLGLLGWRLGSRRGRVAAVFGILAGLGVVGVGLTPMNDLVPHLAWAFVFFWSGLAAVALFTSAVWRDGSRHLPRWLAIPGIASIVVFAVFLAWPFFVGPPDRRMLDPASGVSRPDVWGHAVLEWMVLLALLAFAGSGAVAAGGPSRTAG